MFRLHSFAVFMVHVIFINRKCVFVLVYMCDSPRLEPKTECDRDRARPLRLLLLLCQWFDGRDNTPCVRVSVCV